MLGCNQCRTIVPYFVPYNIGVFVPAYTAWVNFRVGTINHRSLAQWVLNIFIHHNTSLNPEGKVEHSALFAEYIH